MVEAARRRGLDARLVDGQQLAFAAEFDAVFSNAALHWMPDAGAVIAGVRRALRPGGRFVGEFGGHGNVATIVDALRAVLTRYGVADGGRMPWYFPTPAAYAAKLEAGDFAVGAIDLFPRPTPSPPTWRAGSTFSARASSPSWNPPPAAGAQRSPRPPAAPPLRRGGVAGPPITSVCASPRPCPRRQGQSELTEPLNSRLDRRPRLHQVLRHHRRLRLDLGVEREEERLRDPRQI